MVYLSRFACIIHLSLFAKQALTYGQIPCLRIDGKTGGIGVSGKAEQVITGIQANTVAAASINGDTGTVEANNVQCAVTGISVKPSRYHKHVSVLTAKPK